MRRLMMCAAAAVICCAIARATAAQDELVKPTTQAVPPIPETLSPDTVGLRVRLGLKDADPTDWSGKIEVSPGSVATIRGWRWAAGDGASGNSFTIRTRREAPQGAARRPNARGPVTDCGLVLTLEGVQPDSKVKITTPGGEISFGLSEIPYGKRLSALKGAAEIERTPAVAAAARTNADEDYPCTAVARDGTVYLAYLAFSRGTDFQEHRERLAAFGVAPEMPALNPGVLRKIEKPEDLDYLREPVGGETLYLRSYRGGKWSSPVVIAKMSPEMYRPSVAIDGGGKVWIFYPAHLKADADFDGGDWELLARSFDPSNNSVSDEINLSNTPGTDFMPAAAADSKGNVYVTWVGGREMHFNIFVAQQDGDHFTSPQRISKSDANEWEPAIAADRTGNLAVAWDTYEKGDYDVYVSRRGSDGKFSEPTAVAATLNFEVRPSLAYDADSKLWIAWEESGALWGKDFGGVKKKGIPLYSGNRTLGVKVLDAEGKWLMPPDIGAAIGGPMREGVAATGAAGRGGGAAGRPVGLGQAARARSGNAPCYPRLATDDQGRVWLAFRGRQGGNWRVGVGSVWFEYVTRLDGDAWLPATWLPHSNNVLDNRPNIVANSGDRSLLVFYSGDGRGEVMPAHVADPHVEASAPAGSTTTPADGSGTGASDDDARGALGNSPAGAVTGAGGNQNRRGRAGAGAGPDPNDDIYLAIVRADDSDASKPALQPASPVEAAKSGVDVEEERAAVKACRDYRINLNGEELRIWRGEFHRHTEFSPDGGGDGGLLDMWRYAIDAAGLDWIGDGDHDYGNGREYSWWTTQKAVTLFTIPNHFTPVFSYERSVVYPEGHRNCMFARRGLRSLPRLPLSSVDSDKPAPDTNLLYVYLHHFDGVCASHTSATNMGTDWRNNDPEVEPFVEIYQGDRNNYERPDAPRSAVTEAKLKQSTPETESFGGWQPKGFVNLALLKGYRLAFESSSDHISTHLSYCNVLVTEPTKEGILAAIKKRRVYGSTDNIVADVRCTAGGKEHLMGEEFTTNEPPTLKARFVGAQKIAKVTIIKDDMVVYESQPDQKDVQFSWTDPSPTAGKTSYYYIRGEQVPDMEGASAGELVWASPMWIKYEPK